MPTATKSHSQPVDETEKASEPMSTYVPTEVGDCIREDARDDDRSESYIIAKILKRHYAKRVARKTAPEHRRAA